MPFPKKVTLVEVGPRDGLQNEIHPVPTNVKIDFINLLSTTGLTTIEATSFVSPKWIPQLADATEVFQKINKDPNIVYPVLVPNEQGLTAAINAGATHIAVLSSASDAFCLKNINCTSYDSMQRISKIITKALANNIKVRGYLSCVLGCPYEGNVSYDKTTKLAQELINLGCYEVSLGDTIGYGTPNQAKDLLTSILAKTSADQIAVHYHDTYGQALANIYVSLEFGIATIDCSIAGLGGCPYARGASGNVATEDVLYMLNGMKIPTGIDFAKIIQASRFVSEVLGHQAKSKVALAELAKS